VSAPDARIYPARVARALLCDLCVREADRVLAVRWPRPRVVCEVCVEELARTVGYRLPANAPDPWTVKEEEE